jgi:hypothetical protein
VGRLAEASADTNHGATVAAEHRIIQQFVNEATAAAWFPLRLTRARVSAAASWKEFPRSLTNEAASYLWEKFARFRIDTTAGDTNDKVVGTT